MSPVINGSVNPQMGDDQQPGNINVEANIQNDADIPEPSIDTGHGSYISDSLSIFDGEDGNEIPPNVEDNQPQMQLPSNNDGTSDPNIQFNMLNNRQYAYHHPNFSHPLPCYFGTRPANPSFPTMQPATPFVSLNCPAPAESEPSYTPSTDQQDFNRTNVYVENSSNHFDFISLSNQQNSHADFPNLPPYFLPNPVYNSNYCFYSDPNSPPNLPPIPLSNPPSNSFNLPPNPPNPLFTPPPVPSSNIPLNHPQNLPSSSTSNSLPFHSPHLQPNLYPMYAYHSQYPPDPQNPPQHSPNPQYPLYIPNEQNPRQYSQNVQYPQYFPNSQYSNNSQIPYNPQNPHNLQNPNNSSIPYNPQISHNPQNSQYSNNSQHSTNIQYIPNPVQPIPLKRLSNFPQNACCPSNCCDGDNCCQHYMCTLKLRNTQAQNNNEEPKLSRNPPAAMNPWEPHPPERDQNQILVNQNSKLVETSCCSVICCDLFCCQHSNCRKKNRPSEQNDIRENHQASPENIHDVGKSSAWSQNGDMVIQNHNSMEISCCSVDCCKSSCCQHSNCGKYKRPSEQNNIRENNQVQNNINNQGELPEDLPEGANPPALPQNGVMINQDSKLVEISCCSVNCCKSSCCHHSNCAKNNKSRLQDEKDSSNEASDELHCCLYSCCLLSCCTHLNCKKYKIPQPQRTRPGIQTL